MEAVALPENATNKQLKYTSADEGVAVVDEKGTITAIAKGTTIITVAATDGGGKKVEVSVTVTKKQRPRTIITQDGEVDDMDSLIHFLLYTNEIDVKGIIQSSSQHHWIGVEGKETPEDRTPGVMKSNTGHKFSEKKRWPGTDWMFKYLDAYAKVYPNLKKHDSSFPTPNYLRSITKIGNIGYEGEMDAPTEGSELISTYLEGEGESDQFGANEDLLDSTNWWGRRKYQRYDFLSEGDSPTFFMLFDTGLRSLEDSTYGGWSGRLAKTTTRTNKDGVLVNYWSPVVDTYYNEDGSVCENPATILSSWKYVDDIQNDFSARADWCITNSYDKANHAPSLSVEGGTDVTAAAGEVVKLKAIASDPDGDYVTVKWNHYSDADTYEGEAGLTLKGAASDMVSFTVPADAKSGDKIHLIAQAQDDGEHTLTHYQQVIVTVK